MPKVGDTKRKDGRIMIYKSYVGTNGQRKKGWRIKASKRGKKRSTPRKRKVVKRSSKRKSPKIGDTRRNDAGRIEIGRASL